MSKKLIGVVSLLVIVALALPVAAGAAPHYYKNGTKIVEGEKIPSVGWGTLTLTSAAGAITCHNAAAGYVENVAAEGKGATQAFDAYECVSAACPADMRAEAYKLPWLSTLEEPEAGVVRSKSVGIEVVIGCWSAPATGPGNVSTGERGTPLAELLPFVGESTPKSKNGTSAGKPSKVEFGTGSGELINSKVGGGKTTGSTTLMGYAGQEVITTGP